MVFRLPKAQLSKERSVFVLFKVYWDWIQFVFKVPLLWEGKRGLSLTAREPMQGSAAPPCSVAVRGNSVAHKSFLIC